MLLSLSNTLQTQLSPLILSEDKQLVALRNLIKQQLLVKRIQKKTDPRAQYQVLFNNLGDSSPQNTKRVLIDQDMPVPVMTEEVLPTQTTFIKVHQSR
jgi:hypothetical protein